MHIDDLELTQLKETFTVDKEGWLVRIRKTSNRSKLGRCSLSDGYPIACWKGKRMLGYHIAWALYYGEWPDPTLDVDHIDRQRWNCAQDNLRQITRSQNMHNTIAHCDAKVSIKGVDFVASRRKPWRARLCVNYKTKQIGYFHTKEEASAALESARLGMQQILEGL